MEDGEQRRKREKAGKGKGREDKKQSERVRGGRMGEKRGGYQGSRHGGV